MSMKCLAFDLGASNGKMAVAVYDGRRVSLDFVHRFRNRMARLADGLYWDFVGIWNEYLTGIGRGLRKYPDLASVGACTFCNDFSFIDRDGELLAPVRAYRDPRTIRTEDAIYSLMSREELYAVSGNQIAPFNTLMQLAAMKIEAKDAVLSYADKLLFLPDLLTFYLTGERVTERTIASVTQMYSHGTADWSPEVLGRFGLDRDLFAALGSAGSVAGRLRPGLLARIGASAPDGLNAIVTAEHDTASAFMAARAAEDRLIISSGTWSIVGCEWAAPVITDYGFRYNIANEGGVEGHHRLLKNVMGNWLMQEVAREFEADGVAINRTALDAEAARLGEPYRFAIDPDSDEFYEPGGMREKIVKVCMEKYGCAPASPAEFAVCVGTSLAFKYRWAMEKLATLRGRAFSSVNVIGGGSRDALTAQRTADVTGLPVVCGPADASVLGNVIFQLRAAGEIAGVEEGRALVEVGAEQSSFEPSSETARAGEAYEKFRSDFGI